MNIKEAKYKEVAAELCQINAHVSEGKMMHAPALVHQDRVFCFFYQKSSSMVFKLGKDFEPISSDLPFTPFNPFKNKGPLAGWFQLSFSDRKHWLEQAKTALQLIDDK